MPPSIHDNQTFEDVNHSQQLIRGEEFHDCTFKKCDFSNSDVAHCKFVDCLFDGCNLTMMKLGGTTLNNVVFKHSKILGVNFSQCQDFLFTVNFDSCLLDYASFMGKKMLKTRFDKCSLKEASFSGANLAGSVFEQANLMDAIFSRTDLTGVNFTTAYNYIFDPDLNIMRKAIFSMDGLPGLLTKHGIRIV